MQTVDGTIDAREAVKALDGYCDKLARLSLLLEADHFQQEETDIVGMRKSLGAELRQVSRDAINFAAKIVGVMGQPSGQAINPTLKEVEVNAAVGRVVAACNRAGQEAQTMNHPVKSPK